MILKGRSPDVSNCFLLFPYVEQGSEITVVTQLWLCSLSPSFSCPSLCVCCFHQAHLGHLKRQKKITQIQAHPLKSLLVCRQGSLLCPGHLQVGVLLERDRVWGLAQWEPLTFACTSLLERLLLALEVMQQDEAFCSCWRTTQSETAFLPFRKRNNQGFAPGLFQGLEF